MDQSLFYIHEFSLHVAHVQDDGNKGRYTPSFIVRKNQHFISVQKDYLQQEEGLSHEYLQDLQNTSTFYQIYIQPMLHFYRFQHDSYDHDDDHGVQVHQICRDLHEQVQNSNEEQIYKIAYSYLDYWMDKKNEELIIVSLMIYQQNIVQLTQNYQYLVLVLFQFKYIVIEIKLLEVKTEVKMINFATLLGNFRNSSNSGINYLLDSPDVDITRLLDQDSFLNQYKSANTKLIQFMKYHQFQMLVEYVTIVGPPHDKKRSYKFPLIASQVLSCDSNSILDLFFPETQIYLDKVIYEDQEVQVEHNDSISSPDQLSIKQEVLGDVKSNNSCENVAPIMTIQDNLEIGSNLQNFPQNLIKNTENEQKQKGQKAKLQKNPKNLVKVVRKVQKLVKISVEPLLGSLFEYFSGQVNYTLAGYVSKILLSFINKKPIALIKYILTSQNRTKLLNHIQSRSVCDLIVKIMSYESSQLLKQRRQFFQQMITKLSINSEIFVISNLSACINQIIQKCILNIKGINPIKQFFAIYFAPSNITSIIANVMSQYENVSVYSAQILLTYLKNIPLNAPENQQLLKSFQQILELFIDKACEKLTVTKAQRKTFGFGRIIILQIITFILKQDILNTKDIISKKKEFFVILFSLCQNYQMNNILHNQIVKIIDTTLLSNSDSSILKSLLVDDVLLNFLVSQYKIDLSLKTQKNKKPRKGYVGHLIIIANKIQEYSAKNQSLEILSKRTEFQTLMAEWIERQTFQNNKNLGGFTLRKNLPQKVMFLKEEVIAQHINFLTNCPVIYLEEDQQINIEPDLIEELEKQLDSNLKIQKMQEKEEIEQKEEEIREEMNPKYWCRHIQYNLDDLIDEL